MGAIELMGQFLAARYFMTHQVLGDVGRASSSYQQAPKDRLLIVGEAHKQVLLGIGHLAAEFLDRLPRSGSGNDEPLTSINWVRPTFDEASFHKVVKQVGHYGAIDSEVVREP
jgi:hypothetical protein